MSKYSCCTAQVSFRRNPPLIALLALSACQKLLDLVSASILDRAGLMCVAGLVDTVAVHNTKHVDCKTQPVLLPDTTQPNRCYGQRYSPALEY